MDWRWFSMAQKTVSKKNWIIGGLKHVFIFQPYSPTARLAMGSLAQKSSGAIRCSCNPRFRRRFRKVPEGSGAESWWGSRGFRCRKLLRFRRVPVESWWGSGGFRCRWLMRFLMVPAQIADEVPEGSGADGWWSSGRFRCRKLMRFRRVAGQIADEVLEGSGTHSKQSSGGFRYKNIPRSSKLFGIARGFIF